MLQGLGAAVSWAGHLQASAERLHVIVVAVAFDAAA